MSLNRRRVVLILLVLLVLVNSSPLILKVPGIDSGIFLYTARQMLRGDVPYRDIWDHKAPGIYFINMAALILSPESRWGLWILEVISLSAAALLSFASLKTAFGESPAFWGTIVWVASFILIYEKGNFTEEFALPFKFATLLFFLQLLSSKKYVRYGYWIGLVAGLTFFLRQNLMGFSITCTGFSFMYLLQKRQWKNLVQFLLSTTAGFITITLIFVVYFGFNRALDDFWDAAFHFNFVYVSKLSFYSRMRHIVYGLSVLFRAGVVPAALLGWLTIVSALYKQQFPQKNALLWIGILTLPLEFFLSSLSGKDYLHYYLAWLPIMGLLTSFLIYYVSNLAVKMPELKQKTCFLTSTRLLMLLPFFTLFSAWIYTPSTGYEARTNELAKLVTASTHPSDKVLVWGHNPSINFLADREAPTRYIYQTPLFITAYGTEEIFAEFYRDITANPPVLIVEDEALEIPALNSAGISVWKNKALPPSIQAFFDFVSENYVQTENKAIYRYVGK